MFEIKFLEDQTPGDRSDDGKSSYAQITIDNFSERILIPLVYWNEEVYKKHWSRSIKELLNGKHTKCVLLTSMYKLSAVNFLLGWVLYLEGEDVYVRNQLFDLQITKLTGADDIRKLIMDRQHNSTQPISEWHTTRGTVQAFYESELNRY